MHTSWRSLATFSFLAISFWYLAFAGLEYWITEYKYSANNISTLLLVMILLSTILLTSSAATLTSWYKGKPSQFPFIFALIICMISLQSFITYRQYYQELQHYPKILRISKKWTIQGDRFSIEGRNFGEVWQQGVVEVGGSPYKIVSWNRNRIVAEQPVLPPAKELEMVLTNYRGKKVAIPGFEIKDPTEVLK